MVKTGWMAYAVPCSNSPDHLNTNHMKSELENVCVQMAGIHIPTENNFD